jgi:hypothetical protein
MPRRARLAVEGIHWHIIQRGNNRTACFYCADDYQRYLQDLDGQATNGNYVLGDSRFGAEVEAMLQRRVTPGKAGRPVKD